MSAKAQEDIVEIRFHLQSQLIHSLITKFDVKPVLRERLQTAHTPYANKLRVFPSRSGSSNVLNSELGVLQQMGPSTTAASAWCPFRMIGDHAEYLFAICSNQDFVRASI